MKAPRSFFQKYLFVPLYKFHKNFIGKSARHAACQKVANFIYDKSKETASIMLFFNAASIYFSHRAQIKGLKKSDRENKDYLIKQEKVESVIDLGLSVIPPMMVNKALMKKLDSGLWTTKKTRYNLLNKVTPTAGVTRDELYNTDHIKKASENFTDILASILESIKNSNHLPDTVKNKFPNPLKFRQESLPSATMEDIAIKADAMKKGKFEGFYNGKAYDEICGQRNGLLILTTIGFSILASNIVMPILKNVFSNYFYKKDLERKGETPESIARKKRYGFNEHPILKVDENSVFNNLAFENRSPRQNVTVRRSDTFSSLNNMTSTSYNNRLRI